MENYNVGDRIQVKFRSGRRIDWYNATIVSPNASNNGTTCIVQIDNGCQCEVQKSNTKAL